MLMSEIMRSHSFPFEVRAEWVELPMALFPLEVEAEVGPRSWPSGTCKLLHDDPWPPSPQWSPKFSKCWLSFSGMKGRRLRQQELGGCPHRGCRRLMQNSCTGAVTVLVQQCSKLLDVLRRQLGAQHMSM